MDVRYELDPVLTRERKAGVLRLWADVVNAGGAVGFVPTVRPEDVRPELDAHLAGMAEGTTRMLLASDEDDRVVGTAFLKLNSHRLMRHWLWMYTIMLHPDRQGRGEGRQLLAAAEKAAGGIDGITGIRLTCRGGMGLERFYKSCGYREVGRVPGAIRVAEGDYRDDITLWLALG
ncbi:GNAT family N-acetyltransferase [Streptomyces sp. ACA25]|uniref:GNAT family N-acetyltransferase n=1 Tax=Streptomyces sp. ACA25 TaxID=3022596 RepID=UPI002307759F|nr:GNAT family N-acetyltransferase [Streptomyces sp. ACA25]MDB1090235.1 GNAT family N-acetyltransferase [Streptomyces sp. ACA25]